MRSQRPWCAGALALGLLLGAGMTQGPERAVTVLTDYEDASIATSIGAVQNVLAADCAARRVSIPARGQGALALDIGATARGVSVECALTFREPTRFPSADRIATFCWINDGPFDVIFQVRDAREQVFETEPQTVRRPHRWERLSAELAVNKLKRVRGSGPLVWPIEVQGYRVKTERLGKQTVLLDDLLVEHRVDARELIAGRFELNEPTHLYEPGAAVAAALMLENRSRENALAVAVNLNWTRPDGSVLETQRSSVRLPPGGDDFRSYRELDFSQRIREPGLYKLIAEVRATGWPGPKQFETTIAVTPSNRSISRGRSTFFGVRTNLLREPELDQVLEIGLARDIGANLLCVDLPWRRVQPKADTFDFTALDPVIDKISARDMAAVALITEPPEWLRGDLKARSDAVAGLIEALCDHCGGRLERFLVDGGMLGGENVGAELDSVRRTHAQVVATHAQVQVFGPPVSVADPAIAAAVANFIKTNADAVVAFRARGELTASLEQLEIFRQRGGFLWQPTHLWLHDAEPLAGLGHYVEAEAVLRQYVRAAAAGVGGLIWFDLRDDDNDPRQADDLRGLVRRDFSPKTSLLGYAAAAGQLTGYRCVGEVAGAPDAFDSGLFIGADRQVAVLLPRPNRVLPAVVVPLRGSPGTLSAQDFERREQPVQLSAAPPVLATSSRPLFVALTLKQPQPDAQLSFVRPWLRVPHTVFCGANEDFTVEIDALLDLRNSYLQIVLPKDAAFESSVSATGVRAAAGETVRIDVRLSPKAGRVVEPTDITLRLSLEGQTFEVPLEVRSLAEIAPQAGGASAAPPTAALATLTPPKDARATASAQLFAAYGDDALRLTIEVDDDRLVPAGEAVDGTPSGDRLRVGVAREGRVTHAEVSVDPTKPGESLQPLPGTEPAQIAGWRCALAGEVGGRRRYELTIPSPSLGGPLRAGDHLCLAVQYADDDADGFPPITLGWGAGLDGSGSTAGFRWVRLGSSGSGGVSGAQKVGVAAD